MGDRIGPGGHRDHDDDTGDHAPRHLPSTPPPGRYDLGYGAHQEGGRNGTAVRTPPAAPPPTTPAVTAQRPPAPPARPLGPTGTHTAASEADTGQMPIVPGPDVTTGPDMVPDPAAFPGPAVVPGPAAGPPSPPTTESLVLGPASPGVPPGFGAGLSQPELQRRIPAHAHARGWTDPFEGGGAAGPEPGGGLEYDDEHRGVRGLASDAAWRYRSAPLRVRIVADITAASLVLLLIVGAALALRQDGDADQATADTRPPTTVSTTTTVATTTTTLPPTTTTAPTTTTTTAPTTTTTAAPVIPPPTEAPTTTVPPTTTTTEPVHYRSCRSARAAGALPLYAGQPGYGEHLDSDGDGEACDDFDDWGGGGR